MRDLIKNVLKEYITEGRTKKWSDEYLKDLAKGYVTKSQFNKENPSQYSSALRRGEEFYQDITSHMTRSVKWDESKIRDEAKKYRTKGEFRKGNTSAYQAALKKGEIFFNEVTSHMDRNRVWTSQNLRDEVKKYETLTDFKRANPSAWITINRKGLSDEIFDLFFDKYKVITDDEVLRGLKQYSDQKDLKNRNLKLYDLANYRNLLTLAFPKKIS